MQFDGGYWIVLAHGAKAVLAVEDRGGPPRAGTVTYRNTWGLDQTQEFTLRAPKRLA